MYRAYYETLLVAGRNTVPKQMVHNTVIDYKWFVIGGAAAVVGAVAVYNCRAICSKLCHITKTNVNTNIRSLFSQTFRMSVSKPRGSDHSHPKSAQNRTDAERSIDDFIVANGYEPYSVSTSARDKVGQRLYYSVKDVDLPYVNTTVTDNHILRMVDVDYYANIEAWLWKGRPLLLYTFVPETVGGEVVEGTFSIADDVVNVIYNGGGTYRHKLWDYNTDHFVIKGLGYSLMVKVDQVKTPNDPQRRIILLTPTTWYFSIFNWLFDEPKQLSRRKFTYGDANVSTFTQTEDDTSKTMVSLSAAGTPSNVSIEYKTFVGLCIRLQQSKHPNMSDVEKYLRVDGVEDAAVLAPIIYAAYIGGWYNVSYKQLDKIVDCGVAQAPHYQCLHPLVTEDGVDIGIELFKPIVEGGAIFPRQSYNNDYQAVEGRVKNVRNNATPPNVYNQYLREFVEGFPMAVCDPVSLDEVMTRQNKPRQQARSEQGKQWIGHQPFTVKAFMKKESYQKITDPRNISTCPVSHTVDLSSYTYAAKEYLKLLPWYCPCKTPVDIVDSVQTLVSNHDHVLSCDYSRLDGTISAFLRKVERAVYLRLFKKQYHIELSQLFDAEVKCTAYTATGTKYDPGYSRLSGSPLTTDGNTIIVAFVAYCAARKSGVLSDADICRIPALVYGDDKLVVGIPQNVLERTAEALGLGLKCDKTRRHEPVTFLSRVFVDPWTTVTTMQSPLRALGKIHLSTVRSVDKRIVARYKADGYYVTDSRTPLLSEVCLSIIRQSRDLTDLQLTNPELQREANFWVLEYGKTNTWPQLEVDRSAMEPIVASQLGLSVSELRDFIDKINNGEEYQPIQVETPVSVPATVVTRDTQTVEFPARKKMKGAKSSDTI